jgi:hypothetical protein
MLPGTLDATTTLEELQREALAKASQLGHHLEAFRAAKRDPLSLVAFCHDCRQMVLVSGADGSPLMLCGYALESRCIHDPSEQS